MSKFFGDNRPFKRLMEEAADQPEGGQGGGEGDGEKPSETPTETPNEGEGEGEGDKPEKKQSLVVDDEAESETEKPSEERNVAPEKYDLKLPENSELPDSVVEDVEAFAKENGLSNEAAQKMLDREADVRQAGIKALEEQARDQARAWLKEAKADPEIGGDKWNESVELADHALDQLFPGMDIRQFMNQTGLGNNPTIIKGFKKIGEMLKPEKIDPATKPFGPNKSKLDRFYDHPTSKPR